METYKSVAGFEGLYEVSNLGNVRSIPRLRAGRGNPYQVGHTVLRGIIVRVGYHLVRLYPQDGKSKWTDAAVHRLVATAFIPNPKAKPHINHKDGNKLNNSANNLEWCTPSENQKHAIAIGLKIPLKGEAHAMAKLTQLDVDQIRLRIKNGDEALAISKDFKVSRRAIYDIKLGVSWAA